MNGLNKLLSSHLSRLAVLYLRQSDLKQVRKNRESAINQRALEKWLLELGWKQHAIVVVDGDQGTSARHAAGRDHFQKLVADVALNKIGIVVGYEVSRLARNNADWYQLLELCALFGTLIADSDGIYDPRDFNDRLLLGLKGTMSEAELHSLKLRMGAGRISKAKRGELVQPLPTGLVRGLDKQVKFDPDLVVQERIRLFFRKFRELGTARQVLLYFVRNHLPFPRRKVSGSNAGELKWKSLTSSMLYDILENPAYAGAFVHGRRQCDPTRRKPGRPKTGRRRCAPEHWIACVKNRYPSYITWEEFEENQRKLRENYEQMSRQFTPKPRFGNGAALLAGLVRCARCGHAMSVSYQGGGFYYKCGYARTQHGAGDCQFLAGPRIDDAVVKEFFQALQPAQIDALESVSQKEEQHRQELMQHLEQEVTRLEYLATRAEREYRHVEPENRLVAATLEKNWEQALTELEQARAAIDNLRDAPRTTPEVPKELRESFTDVGRRLPTIWMRLTHEARKSLLRTLVEGVNLERDNQGLAQVRIVWRGKAVTELSVRIPVQSLCHAESHKETVERIRQMTQQGKTEKEIAATLNEEGRAPSRSTSFSRRIVQKLKRQNGIQPLGKPAQSYTISEVAKILKVDASWIYRKIQDGSIDVSKDPKYQRYLIPRARDSIIKLRKLKKGQLLHVSLQPT